MSFRDFRQSADQSSMATTTIVQDKESKVWPVVRRLGWACLLITVLVIFALVIMADNAADKPPVQKINKLLADPKTNECPKIKASIRDLSLEMDRLAEELSRSDDKWCHQIALYIADANKALRSCNLMQSTDWLKAYKYVFAKSSKKCRDHFSYTSARRIVMNMKSCPCTACPASD